MRTALILACVAIPLAGHAQSYNYIPYTPPPVYAPPPFIPAAPIPIVPIPSYHPPVLLPTYPSQPPSCIGCTIQEDDNDD